MTEPRSWLHARDRDRFGREGSVQWRHPRTVGEEVEAHAAMIQHRVVAQVRRAADERGWSVKALATTVNERCPRHKASADTMRRKFRGEVPASCADMIAWLVVAGAHDPLLGDAAFAGEVT
jgi:hypothetical protein